MDQLINFLGAQGDRPIGLVVLIGAGDGRSLQLERLLTPAPRRLVLLEGDPDAAAELGRRVGLRERVEVRATPVAPLAGEIPWCRHNLRSFNGPLNFESLRTHYPRLRAIEEWRQQATSVADVLASLAEGVKADEVNVLALDVPGQEDRLLAAVPEQLLSVFGTLVLRGCREALPQGGDAADVVTRRLLRTFYRKVQFDDQSEPLWPVTLLSFDAPRKRAALRERQFAAAQAAQQRAETRVAALEAARIEQAAALQHAAARHAEELQRWQVQLQRRDEQANALQVQLVDLQHRLDALSNLHASSLEAHASEVESLRAQHHERLLQADQQVQDLTQARERLEREAIELHSRLQSQEAAMSTSGERLADRTRQIELLAKSRDEQVRTADGLQVQLQDAKAALAALELRFQDAEERLESARRQIVQLDAQIHQLEAARANQASRHLLLQDELQRAEGQIELVKNLLLGDAGL